MSCSDQGDEQTVAIVGSSWRLQSVQQVGGQTINIPQHEEYTIEFAEATKVIGRNLCNTYWATYGMQNVHGVAFGEYGATKMQCPIPSYELQFTSLLLSSSSLDVVDSQLKIHSDNGRTILNFVRVQ
jgi:heat shock protein HslJ